jgi:hypothetical protein
MTRLTPKNALGPLLPFSGSIVILARVFHIRRHSLPRPPTRSSSFPCSVNPQPTFIAQPASRQNPSRPIAHPVHEVRGHPRELAVLMAADVTIDVGRDQSNCASRDPASRRPLWWPAQGTIPKSAFRIPCKSIDLQQSGNRTIK